jgi:hypothetical protein
MAIACVCDHGSGQKPQADMPVLRPTKFESAQLAAGSDAARLAGCPSAATENCEIDWPLITRRSLTITRGQPPKEPSGSPHRRCTRIMSYWCCRSSETECPRMLVGTAKAAVIPRLRSNGDHIPGGCEPDSCSAFQEAFRLRTRRGSSRKTLPNVAIAADTSICGRSFKSLASAGRGPWSEVATYRRQRCHPTAAIAQRSLPRSRVRLTTDQSWSMCPVQRAQVRGVWNT